MDLMSIRRGLLAQMANDSRVTTGTFTAGASPSTVSIPFGKTLTDYIFYVELTDESYADFVQEQLESGQKTIAFICKYRFCDGAVNNHTLVVKHNFATTAMVGSATQYPDLYNDHFEMSVRDIASASAFVLYSGYTYQYTLIEM